MNKQLSFAQITSRTFSIEFTNIGNPILGIIVQLIKKYQGRWNPLIQLYQINIQRSSQLIKALRQIDHKIMIKDVPSKYLKSLLNQRGQETNSKIHLLPKNKWKRIFAYDPHMVKRFDFAAEFGSKKQYKNYKRVLLVVWQVMKNKWESQFQSRKVYYENADHYELITPNELYRIESNVILKHGQFNILSYERLSEMHQNLTRSSLQKYNTIMLDDSDMWIQSRSALHKRGQLGEIVRNLLKNKYSASKELVIFTARFIIEKPQLGMEIANTLLPNDFGFEAVAIAKGEANDATWMKKRYINESKYFREMLFIFNSMFLIDLQQSHSKSSDQRAEIQNGLEIDNFYGITLADQQIKKLNYVGNKIKNLNKKQALARFQGQRSINPRSSQARYIQELAKAITNYKLPHIFNFLNHISKNIKLKTIVVVQNQFMQQKMEEFMKQESISYVVYQINVQELQRDHINTNVYLIVRQALLNQYNSSSLQTQKNLKIINNVTHVILVDTFWQLFSVQKENIFKNIVECNPVEHVTDKKMRMVRHFFTVKNSAYNQINMVYRYLENLSAIQQKNYQMFNQKPKIQNVAQQPIYHTLNAQIDEIMIDSSQLDKLNKNSKYGQQKMQLEVKTDTKGILEALAQYDCLSESSQDENEVVLAKQVQMNKIRKVQFIELLEEQPETIYLKTKESDLKVSKPFQLSASQLQAMRKVQQNLQRQAKRRETLRRQMLSKNINKEGFQYRLGQRVYKKRALWRGNPKTQRKIEKKMKRLQVVMVGGRSSMKKEIDFQEEGIKI